MKFQFVNISDIYGTKVKSRPNEEMKQMEVEMDESRNSMNVPIQIKKVYTDI